MMRDRSLTVSPFTSFGDEPHAAPKFRIKRENGQLPQWNSARHMESTDIPGGPREWQIMQRLPWQVTWRLHFPSTDDYLAMDALQGLRSTLRYRAGLTPKIAGYIAPVDNHPVPYQHLPGTLLISLSAVTDPTGGVLEAMATFEVPYVAPVIPEPQPWPDPPDPYHGTWITFLTDGPTDGSVGLRGGDVITSAMRSAALQGDGADPGEHAYGVYAATTNDLLNTDLAGGTTGWTATNGTRSVVSSAVVFGANSLQLVANGAGITSLTQSSSQAAPGPRAVGVWVYVAPGDPVIGKRVQLHIVETGGATANTVCGQYIDPINGTTGKVLTAGWHFLWAVGTVVQPDRLGVRWQLNLLGPVSVTNPSNGDTILVNGMQLERRAVPTPYVPSAGSPGTRAAARLRMPTGRLRADRGWVVVQVEPVWPWTAPPSNPVTFWHWSDGTNGIILDYHDKRLRLRRISPEGTETATRLALFAAGDTLTILARWTSDRLGISLNGSPFATGTDVELTDDFARADMDPGLGTAPTGQPWVDMGSGDIALSDGRFVKSASTTTGKVYAGVDLTATPVEMRARISFAGTYGPHAAVALISSNGEAGTWALGGGHWAEMVHPVISNGSYAVNTYTMVDGESTPGPLFLAGNWPNISGITHLDSVPGSPTNSFYVLDMDQQFDVTSTIDLATSSVRLVVTHVGTGTVLVDKWAHDPTIAQVAGRHLIYQIYRIAAPPVPQDAVLRIDELSATVLADEASPDPSIPVGLPMLADVASTDGTAGHLAGNVRLVGAGTGLLDDSDAAVLSGLGLEPSRVRVAQTLAGPQRVWSAREEGT